LRLHFLKAVALKKQKKHIAILGSTGSIGTQALEVVDNNRSELAVEVLTANKKADLLIEQAQKFLPNASRDRGEALSIRQML
jgi:1-deoxy-D-xylulose 5-phosphate reductoisomerase